ncbi:glutathione S-transferase family protein [Spongorhabdus nitratireducens]
MIKVHHLKQSRSTRVIWLLEELGLDYELVTYDRDPQTNLAPAVLREIHPLGKAPIVEDDGRILVESAAILECLLDKYAPDKLRPARDSVDYPAYQQWLHFAEGSAMLPVLLNLFLNGLDIGEAPVVGYARKEAMLDFAYIESVLTQSDFFVGDTFTAADIMMASVLMFAMKQNMLTEYPATQAYLGKIMQRKAFQKAASFE